jgi:hypothetical protein
MPSLITMRRRVSSKILLRWSRARILPTFAPSTKHIIKALSQLFCPQSAIHGWSGLAIDPTTYLLLEGTMFVIPMDPGATAVYPQWAAPTTIKMIDATFLQDKNYFFSYKNIARACFHMFDANIAAQLFDDVHQCSSRPTPGIIWKTEYDDVI